MNLVFCGIVDIVLVLGTILFAIIGYKKGFIKKVISVAGILVILVFSLIYCGQFAQFLIRHDVFYPGIYGNIHNNIITNLEGKNLPSDATIMDVLVDGLKIPKFMAGFIANGVTSQGGDMLTVGEMAESVAGYLSTAVMNIISFFILAIGIFVITLILKLIANALRNIKLIRVVDGILGSVLYITIFAAIVCTVFCLISYFMNQEWFAGAKAWLEVDMQLTTDKFRLSKLVYNGNIIKRIIELFF